MTPDTSARTPGTATTDTERHPLDTLFAVLSDVHRRRILSMLAEETPRHDAGFTPTEFAADATDPYRFVVELRHVHLPMLAAAGYIEWDEDTEAVRPGPRFDEVAPCLGMLSANAADLPGEWP